MRVCNIFYSKDGVTKKYVQITNDDFKIETSYVNYKNRYIICFSHNWSGFK